MADTALKIPPQSKSGLQRIHIFTSGLVILAVILGFGIWRYGLWRPIQTPQAVPVPGSCKILEEKYCKTAEFFNYTDPKDGQIYKLVGFQEGNLPAETPLFSPVKGKTSWQDARTEEKYTNPFQRVSSVSVMDNNDPKQTRYAFFGGLQTVMPSGTSSADVKEGEVIARVKPGEKIFGYGMAILITQIDGGKEETPEDMLKSLFHSNKP